jgi:aminopeptidase N
MRLERTLDRLLRSCVCVAAVIAFALPSMAAEKQRIQVDDYAIDADLNPATHQIRARARVKFTALEDVNTAVFELNNALRAKVTDAAGKTLPTERVTQDSSIRVPLPSLLTKGSESTLTFDYEGTLQSGDDSPVPGLKLASINDDTTYLLYAARWFPMVGYNTDRFTATISVSVPNGTTVIGSGKMTKGTPSAVPRVTRAAATTAPAGHTTYTFTWTTPSFPGTIIAGTFAEFKSNPGGVDVNVYFKPNHKQLESAYAETAGKEFQYFSLIYGPAATPVLNLVELPDDTVPTTWAPEIAGIAGRSITDKTNYRLVADTVARQWFGSTVSPASKEDFWLIDGFARYSEARYTDSVAGQTAFQEGMKDVAVGALAYDTVPLAGAARLDTFSPEFQSLTTDKGAMILHMLRWVIGDNAFDKTERAFLQQYAGKSVSIDDFRKVAEQQSGQQLNGFFTQWVDSTGAPEFKNKYTVYRVKNGFRIVGEIAQDLDLFRMPVELKIDTDGKTETKRIEVVGTQSPYAVETFGRPRRITIDPDNWVLKNSPDLKVRAAILRGQQLVEQGDLAEALKQFQLALDNNKNSSLAHYRIAEVFFLQRNYQAAANAYRDALNGDGEPRWVEVWSHLRLGNIYDLTGQRERATGEYRQAIQTNDNTQGAIEEARKYLNTPYQREKPKEGQ